VRARENTGKGHHEKERISTVMCPDDAASAPPHAPPSNIPEAKNGLRECSGAPGGKRRKSWMRGGSICSFTQADHCSRYRNKEMSITRPPANEAALQKKMPMPMMICG